MRSTMRSAPIRVSMLACATLGCAACVSAPPIMATPNACASLLPEQWKAGVPSAELKNGGATVGDWIAFGDAQTGQLDKANDRTGAAIGIVERCEKMNGDAVKRSRGFFARILGGN